MLCGIKILKVCIDYGFVFLFILRGEPFINGIFRLPASLIHFSLKALLKGVGLIKHSVIDIHISGMHVVIGKIPVALHFLNVGVVIAKHSIVHMCHVGRSIIFLPVSDKLSACNNSSQRNLRTVGDSGIFSARVNRVDIFAVDSGRYNNLISRHCDFRSIIDCLKGRFLAAVSPSGSIYIYIDFHSLLLFY